MRAQFFVCLFAAALGCASGNPAKKKDVPSTPVPGWVQNPPHVDGRVYAIGRCGPTYWPQDALNRAGEDARGKLAIALQSKMEVLTKRAESSDGSSTHLDLVKAATDMVMQNTVLEATWSDSAGQIDEPGAVFALAYIEVEKSRSVGKQQAVETTHESGVPAWLERLPSTTGRIYAYGYSGPTFRTEDASEYANDDAIDNLARALRSHVQAYALLIENNTGMSIDEYSRTERPEDAFRELIKSKAKVESTWVDHKGVKIGYPAGSVWALAWVDVGSTKGGYQQVANEDTGPALVRTGEAGSEPKSKPPPKAEQAAHRPDAKDGDAKAIESKQAPAEPSAAALGAALARPPAREHKDAAGKLAPYPSEGERCKPGYESSGGWCLPPGSDR